MSKPVWKRVGHTMRKVQILASGKWKFLKGKRGSNPHPTRSSRKARHHTIRRIKNMVRGKRRWFGRSRHRARQGFNLKTVEKLIGIGAFAAPGLQRGKDVWDSRHDPVAAITEAAALYAGVKSGQFSVDTLKEAWTPFVAFTLIRVGVHKLTGMIRKL